MSHAEQIPGMFHTLAWYNRQVNQAIAELASKYGEVFTRAGTTHFGSATELLFHIVESDVVWLRRLWLGVDPAPTAPDRGDGSPERWSTVREALDSRIAAYCGGLTAENLAEEVSYANSAGTRYTQPRWQCLLHMFNHQTHHRGQIAQVLDENGVTNDYSNLVWYLRDE